MVKNKILFTLLQITCFGSFMLAAEIQLVWNNLPESCIIIPDEAIAPEKFAAEELQYHIHKASKAKLPIYNEKNTPSEINNFIYIGNCRATLSAGIDISSLSPSGYIVKVEAKKLFLAGKDRIRLTVGNDWGADWQGTLFAVYDFLEENLSVRWLWPGKLGEVIPETDNIVIKQGNRRGKPKFVSTKLRTPDSSSILFGWQSTQNGKDFLDDQKLFLLRHRFSSVQNMYYGHRFLEYWKRFGKTHPEFFSLLPDGRRVPLKGDRTGRNITLCVSQPKLWEQIIKDWANSSERKSTNIPYRQYVNACENDSPGMCTCAACRAWDYPAPEFEESGYWNGKTTLINSKRFLLANASWGEGVLAQSKPASLSERYVRFYLALLKEAEKIDPAAKVVGYAYANYWEAPKLIKPVKGIIISYVAPLWFPYTKNMSEKFRKNWDGWSSGGAEMILRPNLTHAGANLPIFYARRFAGDFSFAARRGMLATTFDSLLGAWSAQGPTLYTIVRIHEHPDWSVDKILDEYYSGFGKAAEAIKKYFEYWENHSDSLDEEAVRRYCQEETGKKGVPGGSFKNYVLIASRLFPPEVFANAHNLIDKAKENAQGDKLAEQRVAFIEKGLIDAELTVAVRIAQKKANKFPSMENSKAFISAFNKLKNYRASVERDNICNFGYMAYREKYGAGWPWKKGKNTE